MGLFCHHWLTSIVDLRFLFSKVAETHLDFLVNIIRWEQNELTLFGILVVWIVCTVWIVVVNLDESATTVEDTVADNDASFFFCRDGADFYSWKGGPELVYCIFCCQGGCCSKNPCPWTTQHLLCWVLWWLGDSFGLVGSGRSLQWNGTMCAENKWCGWWQNGWFRAVVKC